jgi:TolB-like protein/AraC-like DNA-binding protein/Tfp pilus assembly protein PilF
VHKELIQKLTNLVEANLANEKFGPDELAREAGISHSHLNRKLKTISNQSISQFIREVRLKKAKELLLNEDSTVAEISYRVGFGSPNYFNNCFHEYFGYSPSELRNNNQENQPEEQPVETFPKKAKRSKILIGLLVALIVLIPFSFFLINNGSKNAIKEKSIAVLPFVDYSQEEGNTYIINGLQEEILDKLEKIEDLQVKSRTAVEKYKDTKLSISAIAKELKVNYILEGSGQKIGDNIRIRLQLIETENGNHLWSKSYEEEVNDEAIFDIQEEVALSVAKELGAVITPEEKTQLTKKPTQNLAAYNFYLLGLNYLYIINSKSSTISEVSEVLKAKQCFEQAIKLDSAFSEAYVLLGHIYINLLYNTTFDRSIRRLFLDSGMMMIKKVFLYDTNNSFAYKLRGNYYYRTGMREKANEDFDKSFELDPRNNYETLYERFWEFGETEDYVNAMKYFYQGKELQPDEIFTLPTLLVEASICFAHLGYPEFSRKYLEEYLKQTNDSIIYYSKMAQIERSLGNFKNALIYDQKSNDVDTSKTESLFNLLRAQVLCRDYNSAYKNLLKIEYKYSKSGKDFKPDIVAGYIYLKNGDVKKADYHLIGSAKELLKDIESNGIDAQQLYSYWDLAKIYSIMGEKRKAFDNLKMLKNRKTVPAVMVTYAKFHPFFDNIRHEPDFTEVVKDMEAKYQADYERAGKWLAEQENSK